MTPAQKVPQRPKALSVELSPVHYLQVIIYRKWLVLGVCLAVSIATIVFAARLPNIYSSETVILVNPQKVPENYVKATVTGDVRNRLGTLTQQILSATRLQKIIESFGLYAEERKKMAREDVIARMRSDINVGMVNGSTQGTLDAFKVSYSGRDPRLVAQVANQLAALFIEENLKVREQQATDTADFLQQQLNETRKSLETQEAALRDFRLKHLGEMPEHQVASLTVLGQLQASAQQVAEALSRAEQQRSYLQSMMAQSAPVVDVDGDIEPSIPTQPQTRQAPKGAPAPGNDERARLAALLTRYTESHPEVQRLRAQIADREAKDAPSAAAAAAEAPAVPSPNEGEVAVAPPRKRPSAPPTSANPVLLSQLRTVEADIAKQRQEQERIGKQLAVYRGKLEAIPLREQQIAELVRDYEINKAHYTQLLDKQLSAQTATQLEIRQKGEQFSVLDPAQPAQRPSSPKRMLINAAGCLAGLLFGVVLALVPEFLGATITSPEYVPQQGGNRVLETIPIIMTPAARSRQRKRMLVVAVSGLGATVVAGVTLIFRLGILNR